MAQDGCYDAFMKEDREYALTLITEYRRLESQIAEKRKELKLWQSRVELAREKGRSDLEEAALNRCRPLESELQELEVELSGLEKERDEAKASWKQERNRQGLSVDAEALARELEAISGPADAAGEELEKLQQQSETARELEELKRSMGLAEKEEQADE